MKEDEDESGTEMTEPLQWGRTGDYALEHDECNKCLLVTAGAHERRRRV